MAKLGSGLSAAQRNDWEWFKQAWDDKMKHQHGADWGNVFAGMMQKILDDFANSSSNAFSSFIHTETARCFNDVVALQVPGAASHTQ